MNNAANGKRWEQDEELETGEPIEDEGGPAPVKKRIRARVVPFDGRAPRRSDRTHDDGDDRPEPESQPAGQMVLTTAKYMPRESLDPEPRRNGQSRKNKGQQSEQSSSLEGSVSNSGKWGGMLAMVVAVVWFMAGMMNDIIFFYPPILFILGLVAFMKDTLRSD